MCFVCLTELRGGGQEEWLLIMAMIARGLMTPGREDLMWQIRSS